MSRYKLSREELEEKRRARQHKPLDEYTGPPIVVRCPCTSTLRSCVSVQPRSDPVCVLVSPSRAQSRKQRSDGTWYVTGARPTSALAMLSAMSDDLPADARRGRVRFMPFRLYCAPLIVHPSAVPAVRRLLVDSLVGLLQGHRE